MRLVILSPGLALAAALLAPVSPSGAGAPPEGRPAHLPGYSRADGPARPARPDAGAFSTARAPDENIKLEAPRAIDSAGGAVRPQAARRPRKGEIFIIVFFALFAAMAIAAKRSRSGAGRPSDPGADPPSSPDSPTRGAQATGAEKHPI